MGAVHAADMASATPEIFAPGTISGPAGVDCLTFAPDGNTVYFDQQAGWNGFIMEAHRVGDSWSTPQIAPFSGHWQDHDPAMAPAGSFLVYTSTRAAVAGAPALDRESRVEGQRGSVRLGPGDGRYLKN